MYILEGNIGVGKSTFLSLIKKRIPEIDVLTEPLEDWNKRSYGQSLLENFYQDTPRWAYTLETLTMICRSKDHMREQNNPNLNRIFERSIYSGHYCFARNSYESGFMTKLEWKIYNEWANLLLHKNCNPPLGFIYLKADPKICLKRVKKRNRASEKSITLDYINQVDKWHSSFLIEKNEVEINLKNTPVLVLDCNEDFLDNSINMDIHADKVKNFIDETKSFLSESLKQTQACISY